MHASRSKMDAVDSIFDDFWQYRTDAVTHCRISYLVIWLHVFAAFPMSCEVTPKQLAASLSAITAISIAQFDGRLTGRAPAGRVGIVWTISILHVRARHARSTRDTDLHVRLECRTSAPGTSALPRRNPNHNLTLNHNHLHDPQHS